MKDAYKPLEMHLLPKIIVLLKSFSLHVRALYWSEYDSL